MKPRLFLPAGSFEPDAADVVLTGEQSRYLVQVLRLKVGDSVQVFDGQGVRYDGIVSAADRRAASLRELTLTAATPNTNPTARLRLTLVQGMARGDRMDWVIEKSTELGVNRIIPWLAERSTVRLDPARGQKRREHWARISEAACMQCGQDLLPQIDEPCDLSELLKHLSSATDPLLVLAPGAANSLSGWATEWAAQQETERPGGPIPVIQVIAGPESGFSSDEEIALKAAGARSVSIGPRTLRTETAGVVALTILQAICGDLAGAGPNRRNPP